MNIIRNFSGLSKILCEKYSKNVNDCHLTACMGALDQKNDIDGSYLQIDHFYQF